MERRVVTLLIVLAALACAQTVPLSVSRRTILGGKIELTLRNEYESAVTAYVIGYRNGAWPERGSRSSFHAPDSVLAGSPPLIEPKDETRLHLSDDPWEVHAVLFADGAARGDRQWIEALIENRRRALDEISAAVALLRDRPSDILDRFAPKPEDAAVSAVAGRVYRDLKRGRPTQDIIRGLEDWSAQLNRRKL